MTVLGFDHIYVETHHYTQAKQFWQALGFVLADEWGEADHRACRLTCGNTAVVLAKAAGATAVTPTIHFATSDPGQLERQLSASPAVAVSAPLTETHWGTHWMRVRDPDGNEYVLEAAG